MNLTRHQFIRASAAAGAALLLGVGHSAGAADAPPVLVAVNPAFPPFESTQGEEIVGFDVDLIRAIGQRAGFTVQFKSMPFSGYIPSLQSGAVTAAVGAITITKERLKNVLFSDAYYRSGLSLLVKKGSPYKDLGDLQGHVVATQKATSSVDYLSRHGFSDAQIKQYAHIADAYVALNTGGADGVFIDNPINADYQKGHPDTEIVGGLLTGEYYGFAVTKKDPALFEKINAGLADLMKDGEYQAIFKKYFGSDTNGLITSVISPASVATSD